MYPAGRLDLPSTVRIIPCREWSSVCTGLDPVPGSDHTFYAPNYEVLFDCPILAGNLTIRKFTLDSIPYTVAVEKPGETDLDAFVADLKKIIPEATGMFGDIPFDHYHFLIMDQGMGGTGARQFHGRVYQGELL